MSRIDHVALEITDYDQQLEVLTAHLGLRLVREGTRYSTGQRIAMLADDHGVKLELIEAAGRNDGGDGGDGGSNGGSSEVFQHLAVRSDDVDADHSRLLAAGAAEKRPPHRLDAARADTSLLRFGSLAVQVVHYDPDSPDLT